ncbi:hypothetical protein T06_13404 [Trichinella sp. T6]|nr:hypothetical protein T06_13404 [Trichinella sp. T6]
MNVYLIDVNDVIHSHNGQNVYFIFVMAHLERIEIFVHLFNPLRET